MKTNKYCNKGLWKKRIYLWNYGIKKRGGKLKIKPGFVTRFPYCRYCIETITPYNASLDHINPIKRGGKDELQNLQIICKDCNAIKSSMSHDSYRLLSSALNEMDASSMNHVDSDMIRRKLISAWRVQ